MDFHTICVMGLGYIGLPTAATFAIHGMKVNGVDVNTDVINTLQNGGLHIEEPGLQEIVYAAFTSGNLTVSTKPQPSDAFIIAVPTPFYEDKRADLRAVTAATKSIVPYLKKGNLVFLKSTSPPLTTENILLPILEQSGLKAGSDFYLAYTPERVLPGRILHELVENARVIGGITPVSAEMGRDLYKVFVKGEIILTDSTTAEMVKLMENTYRDINIAIANEFFRLAERFGVDIWEAIEIANLHPRVKILKPGIGVGGHCISVDPWFLVEAAPDITPLVQAARRVNDSQPIFVIELIRNAIGGDLLNHRIAVLGLSYKPDVDDLRESPAIELVRLLEKSGAIVSSFEPNKSPGKYYGVKNCKNLQETIQGVDVIVLAVADKEFLSISPNHLFSMTECRVLVDAVHGFSTVEFEQAGFSIYRLGVNKNKMVV